VVPGFRGRLSVRENIYVDGGSASFGRCSAGPSAEQGSNPLARHRLTHLSSTPVFVGRACAAFQQEPDYSRLLLASMLRTVPSSPGGLNCKGQGRRAGVV